MKSVSLSLLFASMALAALPEGTRDEVHRLAAGSGHTCAIREDATIRCWGQNSSGQLGNGSTATSTSASALTFQGGAIAIGAGRNHTCVLLASSSVRCWGANSFGQLGDSSTANRPMPVAVSTGLTGVVSLAVGGDHTCVLMFDGTVRCWGRNESGQLGDGTLIARNAPVQVRTTATTLLTGAVALATGAFHTCAIVATAEVYCWGLNTSGQLGTSGPPTSNLARKITSFTSVKILTAGGAHTCAGKADASLYCWGRNSNGQLGVGDFVNRLTPVLVAVPGSFDGVAAGEGHTCALRLGSLRCWGNNFFGQVGDGAVAGNRVIPVPSAAGIANGIGIAAGFNHTCMVQANDAVQCWGRNNWGQLGNGNFLDASIPQASLTAGQIAARGISVSGSPCAVRASSTVICWGSNANGQLGDGTTTQNVPLAPVAGIPDPQAPPQTPLGVLRDVRMVSTNGTHACALRANGSIVCWGSNAFGELGDGSTTQRLTPVAVLANAIQVSAGISHTCALLITGTVSCWGSNASGQLGDGTNTPRLTPFAVSGLSGVTAIEAGANHTCATLIDGGLRCWGSGLAGKIGDGTGADRNLPVAVGNLKGLSISAGGTHSCATGFAGAACWGSNLKGQVGSGNPSFVQFLVPVGVGGAGGKVMISAGNEHTCALLTTGTLECWGTNARGALGIGASMASLSMSLVPRALNSLANVVAISSGIDHTCAITAAGQPYCWGRNDVGQVGDGTTTDRTSPTLVSSFTFNVVPSGTIRENGNHTELFALANCPVGSRVHIEIELRQGQIEGTGRAYGKCTGGLEKYPVDLHVIGHPRFVPGVATATAVAEIWGDSKPPERQTWTRIITLAFE